MEQRLRGTSAEVSVILLIDLGVSRTTMTKRERQTRGLSPLFIGRQIYVLVSQSEIKTVAEISGHSYISRECLPFGAVP